MTDEGLASMKALAALSAEEPLAVLAQYRIERFCLDQRDAGAALASIAAFRRAEPPRAGEAEALLSAAREKARAGNPAAAREFYEAYLDRFPGKPGADEPPGDRQGGQRPGRLGYGTAHPGEFAALSRQGSPPGRGVPRLRRCRNRPGRGGEGPCVLSRTRPRWGLPGEPSG